MKLVALLALLAAGAAQAQSPIALSANVCVNGKNVDNAVALTSLTAASILVTRTTPGGSQFCAALSKVLPTWYIWTKGAGAAAWTTTLVSSLGPLPPVAPPVTPAVNVLISWGAVTQFVGGGAISIPVTYNIYRGTTSSGLTKVGTSSALTYTDSAVVAGTTYYYSVTATCAGCAESQQSAVASGAPIPVTPQPIAPTGVTAR